MTLHPGLQAVAGLLGTWRGEGSGEYPTIKSFSYTEELTFTDVGKPFLHYQQRTWSPAGAPMHTETGFLRVIDSQTIEFVLAQPTGQTELAQGALNLTDAGFICKLDSQVVNSASAKQVQTTRRQLELSADQLSTSFAMAAVGVPLTHHLASVLHRLSTTS
ncbi:UPF0678 fatty acid-binding protein-like protein [Glutamicibacter uratoxydans]|uniref:Peroxynitrite isomerase n=1 Tax=Glutamicibacter uratoxydans TaxID=43667 RepID=A0A4Y4DVY0_GLUUR|nr:FABP family protein [Glutamicibacter uratoxydans]GED07580.1 UPF0678 fatty acid-binding protein-like protein [Glutamicibacter uratoxydans]